MILSIDMKQKEVRVKRGPQRNYEMVNKVVSLRRKGLSYRKISKELGKDIKTVHTWASYAVGEFIHN